MDQTALSWPVPWPRVAVPWLTAQHSLHSPAPPARRWCGMSSVSLPQGRNVMYHATSSPVTEGNSMVSESWGDKSRKLWRLWFSVSIYGYFQKESHSYDDVLARLARNLWWWRVGMLRTSELRLSRRACNNQQVPSIWFWCDNLPDHQVTPLGVFAA